VWNLGVVRVQVFKSFQSVGIKFFL